MQVIIKRGVMLALVGTLVACSGPKGEKGDEGQIGPQGPAGATGSAGATGPAGRDGSLRIYGDGSGGAVTIGTNTNWVTTPPAEFNFQFASLTINAGVTLTVPSGTVIRCTETFTNAGTIVVDNYAAGGAVKLTNTSATEALVTPADPGISRRPAGIGERAVGSGVNCDGGRGGLAILRSSASQLLNPGPVGGGAGAGAAYGSTGTFEGSGGAGGGTFVALAQGAISNTGTIRANASTSFTDGAGGGAGGIIVLASQTSVTQNGTVSAIGTAGGPSGLSTGPGGGGGGGIILFVAPDANNIGTVDVAGGAAGSLGAPGTATATGSRMGGAGGGACGGNGGNGGDLSGTNPLAAVAGSTGLFIVRRLDPTTLF